MAEFTKPCRARTGPDLRCDPSGWNPDFQYVVRQNFFLSGKTFFTADKFCQ